MNTEDLLRAGGFEVVSIEEALGTRLAELERENDGLRSRLAAAEARLDRDLVHLRKKNGAALCGHTPGYMSMMRLTDVPNEVVCKRCFDLMLAASEARAARLSEALKRVMELDQTVKHAVKLPAYEGYAFSSRAAAAFDIALTDIFETARAALGTEETAPERQFLQFKANAEASALLRRTQGGTEETAGP